MELKLVLELVLELVLILKLNPIVITMGMKSF